MEWKTILALAVFVMPMAYCEIDNQRSRNAVKIACIENHGEWSNLRNNCDIDSK